jgi:hypothetical protein
MKEIERRIRAIIDRALKDPEPVINWIRLLDGAERAGRITRSRISVLQYALNAYLWRRIEDDLGYDPDVTVSLILYDGEVDVGIRWRRSDESLSFSVDYPNWLVNFFDADAHFELLVPGCKATLAEVIETLEVSTGK